jgi:hypothetical protein
LILKIPKSPPKKIEQKNIGNYIMSTVQTLCHDILSEIEEVKHKITDGEYKKLIDVLTSHHEKPCIHVKESAALHELHMLIIGFHAANGGWTHIKNGVLSQAIYSIHGMMAKAHWREKSATNRGDTIMSHLLQSHVYQGCYVLHECEDDLEKECIASNALEGLTGSQLSQVVHLINTSLVGDYVDST